MVPERIANQYQQFCRETCFKPFSRSTMVRVLSSCGATVSGCSTYKAPILRRCYLRGLWCYQLRNKIIMFTITTVTIESDNQRRSNSFDMGEIDSELWERTPRFHQFLTASVSNPSQARNIFKKGTVLITPMWDASCQLIFAHSEQTSATCHLRSIILKGGLKKVGFKRLSPLYNCIGYNATNIMSENFGKDFDAEQKVWKNTVEEDVKKDNNPTESKAREDGNNEAIKEANAYLIQHRQTMHPS